MSDAQLNTLRRACSSLGVTTAFASALAIVRRDPAERRILGGS
jgi:hypothetical protein